MFKNPVLGGLVPVSLYHHLSVYADGGSLCTIIEVMMRLVEKSLDDH